MIAKPASLIVLRCASHATAYCGTGSFAIGSDDWAHRILAFGAAPLNVIVDIDAALLDFFSMHLQCHGFWGPGKNLETENRVPIAH
jgi:hypothetical protein